jgi:predicted phage terminase large subunit-like protein
MAKKKSKNKDVLEEMLNDQRVRSELARMAHLLFFSFYFSESIKYEIAPFQEQLFALTEDELIKLAVIVAFRGSAKSTIITTSYAIWSILGVQQKKFVVIASQTEAKARQHLQNIKRELENNTLLQQDLGPFQEERDQWGATSLYLPKFNAKIMISSVGQSIRGMRHGAYRPDLIILDDVEDTESVKTQEGRDKVWDWLTKDVIPAGDLNTRLIAVGNLLHEDSLLKRLEQKIKNNDINGVYLEFPIVDEEGNPLWIGKFPNKEAVEQERKKIMNNVAWSVEYLLKIVSEDEQIIKNDWIHYYDELPEETPDTILIGTDLAISKELTADYTTMVPLRVYWQNNNPCIYVLPNIVNMRMTSLESINVMKELADLLGATILIEDVGYQRSVFEQLERDNYATEAVKLHGKDKQFRLNSVSHLFQGGKVFFPNHGAELLIRQLLGFGKEKHDDLVDALTLAINHSIDSRPIPNGWSQIVQADFKEMEEHPERLNAEQKAILERLKRFRRK